MEFVILSPAFLVDSGGKLKALSDLREKGKTSLYCPMVLPQACSLSVVLILRDCLALHSSSPKNIMSYVTMSSYSLQCSTGNVKKNKHLMV